MREAWPAHKPMSVRISATDWAEGGAHGRGGGPGRARLRRGRRRPRRRLDRADGRRGAADLRAHVPDAVRGPDPQRGAASRRCASAPSRRPDQVNTILAAGRADLVALGAPAPRRPVLHHEGGGLVRRAVDPLPAAIPAGQGPDLPQLASAIAPTSTTCASAPSRRRGRSSRPSGRRSGSWRRSRRQAVSRSGGVAVGRPEQPRCQIFD